MAALVEAVVALDHGMAQVPALFWFSNADTVVDPAMTHEVAAMWGGPVQVVQPELGPGDDPSAHVIAGDIVSPGQTEAAVAGMLDWIGGL